MAKRVKWVKSEDLFGKTVYTANLYAGLCLFIRIKDWCYQSEGCTKDGDIRVKRFKKLEAAQRYCIREAKKLHKIVGTQLDQPAKEVK